MRFLESDENCSVTHKRHVTLVILNWFLGGVIALAYSVASQTGHEFLGTSSQEFGALIACHRGHANTAGSSGKRSDKLEQSTVHRSLLFL